MRRNLLSASAAVKIPSVGDLHRCINSNGASPRHTPPPAVLLAPFARWTSPAVCDHRSSVRPCFGSTTPACPRCCRSNLPLADRATIIPWLYTAIDLGSTPGSYERYDSMTALEVRGGLGEGRSGSCPGQRIWRIRGNGMTARLVHSRVCPTSTCGLHVAAASACAAGTWQWSTQHAQHASRHAAAPDPCGMEPHQGPDCPNPLLGRLC